MHTQLLDRRAARRKKTMIHAFASDLGDKYDVKCVIRDVSGGGCQIVSSYLDDLPDTIKIVPEGFDRPIYGRIVWRERKVAGVRFLDGADNPAGRPGAAEPSLDFFSRLEMISARDRRGGVGRNAEDFNAGKGRPRGLRAAGALLMGVLGFLRTRRLAALAVKIMAVIGLARPGGPSRT